MTRRTAAELVARIDADTLSPAAPRVAFGVDRGPSRVVRDDAVGVSLRIPESWTVTHDPYLFETYGFMLRGVDPDPVDAHGPIPVARIALDWRSTPMHPACGSQCPSSTERPIGTTARASSRW